MRVFLVLLGLLVAVAGAGACRPSADPVPGADTCAFASDGECDEPANCAVGTDATDCRAACDAGRTVHLHAAACAFYDPAPAPRFEPPVGTGGSVHLTGYRDGTIDVPSGEDASAVKPRHYRLYVPAGYDPAKPAPLVITMPGHRVGHTVLPDNTQLTRTADLNGFLVAYAEQEWRWDSLKWAWWTDWNWDEETRENPDLVFLRRLVERVGEEYNLDRTRVFATGHSRGGAMAIIAALEMPELIAGAVPQSGFTEFKYHQRLQQYSGRKVPMVFVHGVDDPDVCIDCTTGGTCGIDGRSCGGVEASDSLVAMLRDRGWRDDDLVYERLETVTHRWQPHLNQHWYDFLFARPLPASQLPSAQPSFAVEVAP